MRDLNYLFLIFEKKIMVYQIFAEGELFFFALVEFFQTFYYIIFA